MRIKPIQEEISKTSVDMKVFSSANIKKINEELNNQIKAKFQVFATNIEHLLSEDVTVHMNQSILDIIDSLLDMFLRKRGKNGDPKTTTDYIQNRLKKKSNSKIKTKFKQTDFSTRAAKFMEEISNLYHSDFEKQGAKIGKAFIDMAVERVASENKKTNKQTKYSQYTAKENKADEVIYAASAELGINDKQRLKPVSIDALREDCEKIIKACDAAHDNAESGLSTPMGQSLATSLSYVYESDFGSQLLSVKNIESLADFKSAGTIDEILKYIYTNTLLQSANRKEANNAIIYIFAWIGVTVGLIGTAWEKGQVPPPALIRAGNKLYSMRQVLEDIGNIGPIKDICNFVEEESLKSFLENSITYDSIGIDSEALLKEKRKIVQQEDFQGYTTLKDELKDYLQAANSQEALKKQLKLKARAYISQQNLQKYPGKGA
jgi:hypothetical protein